MKKIVFGFFLLFIAFKINAQDTILLRNGNEIITKILEITPIAIKYIKFDAPDSIDTVIKKSDVFMIKYQNHTKELIKDENNLNTTVQVFKEKAKIIIYRPRSFVGVAIGYNLFANAKKITRITNGTYHEMEIEPGYITFYAETESKSEASIELKPGKTYYLKCTITMGAFVGRPEINFVPDAIGEAETAKFKR